MFDGLEISPETAPSNIGAEQAFLGALLYDNEHFHSVGGFLKPEHFYDPVHGRIYETACDRIGAGKLADAVALYKFFDQDGGIKEIGGADYLAVLIESAANPAAVKEYAKMVFELAQRRDLIAIAANLTAAANGDDTVPVEDVIRDAESGLYTIAELGSVSRGYQSFKTHTNTMLDRAASAYENGGSGGIPTGIKELDRKAGGLHPSDLIILAARPSIGKTALATNIAEHAARAGYTVGFPSLEMAGDQISQRIVADRANVPSWKIRQGVFSQSEYAAVRDAAMELSGLPLHIDDTGGISIASLCARARRLKRLHGLDLLIVDYLQLITSSKRGGDANRVQEVSEISAALKALAKELEIPVLALSQLSRKCEERPDKKPQLSDLRESGSIEQDADCVLFLYREAYYKERLKPREDTPEFLAWQDEFDAIKNDAEVIIGKQRHGPIGTARLHFDGERMRFSDRGGEA